MFCANHGARADPYVSFSQLNQQTLYFKKFYLRLLIKRLFLKQSLYVILLILPTVLNDATTISIRS